MAQTYLTKQSPTAGNRTKGTISMWVKRSGIGSTQYIYTEYLNGTDNGVVYFAGGNTLDIISYNGSSAEMHLATNRLFRDTNAWYHLVFAWDTSQGTAADRVKMYINGVQETSFSTATYPSQNSNLKFGLGGSYHLYIGRRGDNQDYFDGCMSHVHRVDNQQLNASVFGSTDSTTGEWKINTSPSITYTGSSSFNFFILKDGNSVTDQSGQSNNLTVGYGTLTKTEDCPSNVFATMNPLYNFYRDPTLSVGNTKIVDTNGWSGAKATLGFSTGKWYWEIKLTGTMENHQHGVQQENVDTISQDPQQRTGTTVFYNHDGGEMRVDGTTTAADYGLYSSGDIMGVAVDMTAGSYGQITYYKNGVALISNYNLSSSSTLVMPFSSVGACTSEYNFGNGYFGTTAVSSAGTNASGNGIFEYDVPANHTALSTKGLNL